MVIYTYRMTDDTGFAPNPFGGFCTLACCKPKIRKGVADRIIKSAESEYKSKSGIKSLSQNKHVEFTITNLRNKNIENYDNDLHGLLEKENIWVVGIIGTKLSSVIDDNILYIMKVTDILTFEEYWNDEQFQVKKPNQNYFSVQQKRKEYSRNSSSSLNCGDNIYSSENPKDSLLSFHHLLDYSPSKVSEIIKHDCNGKYVLVSDCFCYYGSKAEICGLKFCKHNQRGGRIIEERDLTAEMRNIIASINGKEIIGKPIMSGNDFKYNN